MTDLKVTFPSDTQPVTAVRGVSFRVDPGEVVAVVGESGSGKSATAMVLIGLLPDYAEVAGSVRLHGAELLGLRDDAMSRVRGKSIGTVFQDPMSALTPVYTVGDQIAEAIRVHQPRTGKADAARRAVELLELVGIAQPDRRARAFPHELSGGERQRVVIAIAIANDPDLLICDEPTTALDVTVQAQILDVLRTARDVTGAGVLVITHDLGVVAEFADRALVMYAGQVVEYVTARELLRSPRHPYTLGLIHSAPAQAHDGADLPAIPGTVPRPEEWPTACRFADRCAWALDDCRVAPVELATTSVGGLSRCLRVADLEAAEFEAARLECGSDPEVRAVTTGMEAGSR